MEKKNCLTCVHERKGRRTGFSPPYNVEFRSFKCKPTNQTVDKWVMKHTTKYVVTTDIERPVRDCPAWKAKKQRRLAMDINNHGCIKFENKRLGVSLIMPISKMSAVSLNLGGDFTEPTLLIYDGNGGSFTATYDTPKEAKKAYKALESAIANYYSQEHPC